MRRGSRDLVHGSLRGVLVGVGVGVGVVRGALGVAHADDAVHEALHARVTATPSAHLVYAELGGKAGLYGVGYEHALTGRLSLGVAASYVVLRGQHIATAAPYVHATLVRGGRHALFTEVGATLVHSRVPSPVDDWDGMSDTGGGGFVSLGWERATRHLVVRTAGSIVVGEGGVAPWLGVAIGVCP